MEHNKAEHIVGEHPVLTEIMKEVERERATGSPKAWGNWGNWGNWMNWLDWGNWGNWMNWWN